MVSCKIPILVTRVQFPGGALCMWSLILSGDELPSVIILLFWMDARALSFCYRICLSEYFIEHLVSGKVSSTRHKRGVFVVKKLFLIPQLKWAPTRSHFIMNIPRTASWATRYLSNLTPLTQRDAMPVTRHFKKHSKVHFSATETRCDAGDTEFVLGKFINSVYSMLARFSNS